MRRFNEYWKRVEPSCSAFLVKHASRLAGKRCADDFFEDLWLTVLAQMRPSTKSGLLEMRPTHRGSPKHLDSTMRPQSILDCN